MSQILDNCPPGCACPCHGEEEDPGPDHLPTCLWADPDFMPDWVLPESAHEADACDKALEAVAFVLDSAQGDPDLWRIIRPGSELFERLSAAEAALTGRPVDEVTAARSVPPHGPRQYMTYKQWAKARAVEIEGQGEEGSHWP